MDCNATWEAPAAFLAVVEGTGALLVTNVDKFRIK